jgi:hypothetical protein
MASNLERTIKMDAIKIDAEQLGWRFGIQWVLLTLAGWVIGFPLGFILGELGLDNAGIEICVGAMVGFMQWIALRRVVNKRAGFWILASITGFLVSSGIHAAACYYLKTSDDLGNPTGVLMWTLSFILGGTLTGLLQQRILRHQVRRSGWWIPASAAGWGLSLIGLAIAYFVLPTGRKGPAPFVLLLIRNLIVPTIGTVLLGIVTGATLIWLLRQPKQQMLDTAN